MLGNIRILLPYILPPIIGYITDLLYPGYGLWRYCAIVPLVLMAIMLFVEDYPRDEYEMKHYGVYVFNIIINMIPYIILQPIIFACVVCPRVEPYILWMFRPHIFGMKSRHAENMEALFKNHTNSLSDIQQLPVLQDMDDD